MDNHGNNESKSLKDHKNFLRNYFNKKILMYEEKNWKLAMNKKSKLRTYRTLKNNLKLEKYLLATNYYRGRAHMTDLRTGTNRLAIETGRWERKSEDLRICTHCSLNQVENEEHFVITCPKYSSLRSNLFSQINLISKSKWTLSSLPSHDSFSILLNGSGDEYERSIFCLVQNYLLKANRLRNS